MKKSLIILLATLATAAMASDNWQNGDGALNWKNGDGTLCWRDNSWTPATAAKGCDGALVGGKTPAKVSSTKITLQADALFDFDKSSLKAEGIIALSDLLVKLKGINTEVVIVVGNTDSIGTDAYNMALGMRRAQTVKSYLVSHNIPADKIYAESKGKSNPVASNATAEGRAKNRRVDVEIVGIK